MLYHDIFWHLQSSFGCTWIFGSLFPLACWAPGRWIIVGHFFLIPRFVPLCHFLKPPLFLCTHFLWRIHYQIQHMAFLGTSEFHLEKNTQHSIDPSPSKVICFKLRTRPKKNKNKKQKTPQTISHKKQQPTHNPETSI